MRKDYCPGFYDLANGGVVGGDETDEENARRELEEEIGITDVELKVLIRVKFEDSNNRVWGSVFAAELKGRSHTDLKLQESEVDAVEAWTVEEARAKMEDPNIKITPDSKLAFLEFLKLGYL